MDRREALKCVGLLMGSAVSASVASGVLAGCKAAPGSNAPKVLSPSQDELVATVSELIIPATDTPGARAARVNVFIDRMLDQWLHKGDRERFLAGISDLDARARTAGGQSFVDSDRKTQTALLTALEQEALAARASGMKQKPFFLLMKELTLTGYYTSEIGAEQELKTVIVPGFYDGDVPYADIGRAWA